MRAANSPKRFRLTGSLPHPADRRYGVELFRPSAIVRCRLHCVCLGIDWARMLLQSKRETLSKPGRRSAPWGIGHMPETVHSILRDIVRLVMLLPLVALTLWAVDPLFSILNRLQYILQRPYRRLLKRPTRVLRPLYLALLPVRYVVDAILYTCAIPIRLLNAVYYDLCILSLAAARDALGLLLLPRRGAARRLRGSAYRTYWCDTFPERLIGSASLVLWALLDGIAMVIVDVVFPTLTMYHGTSFSSAVSITQPGSWVVGSGNYAGTGIYFAMRRSVAEHYSSGGVVICARVTLGQNYPLSCAPRRVCAAVGRDGNRITAWGRSRFIASVEHWRTDHGGWWEHCILRTRHDSQEDTWRIRPLYVAKVGSRVPERIWGGKHIWLRHGAALRVTLTSAVVTCLWSEVLLVLAAVILR